MEIEEIKTPENFLQLIQRNSDPLSHGKAQSDLMNLVDWLERADKQSDEYKRIIKLSHSMANWLNKFDNNDFSSLMSFFALMQINDYDTFLAFECAKDKIISEEADKQALFLKLLNTINSTGFSKLQMREFSIIKEKYPLFWADLYFEIDINESITTLENSNIDYISIEKLTSKWKKYLKKGTPSHDHKLNKINIFLGKIKLNKWAELVQRTEVQSAYTFANDKKVLESDSSHTPTTNYKLNKYVNELIDEVPLQIAI